MKTVINLLLLFMIIIFLIVVGFRLGVGFVTKFDFRVEYVGRGCAFYQDKYKKNYALVICSDGTWWNATPFYQIWDHPL